MWRGIFKEGGLCVRFVRVMLSFLPLENLYLLY